MIEMMEVKPTMSDTFRFSDNLTIVNAELGRLKRELKEIDDQIANLTLNINTARAMMSFAIECNNDEMLDFYSDYWEKQNDIYKDLLDHVAVIMPIIRDLQKAKKEECHG